MESQISPISAGLMYGVIAGDMIGKPLDEYAEVVAAANDKDGNNLF